MPRPRKCRKVCCMPKNTEFVPAGNIGANGVIIMTVDEYETVRLIDREGFSQEECGEYMKVARTTVQQIYNNARRKIAEALVEGFTLRIEVMNRSRSGGSDQIKINGGKHENSSNLRKRSDLSAFRSYRAV